MFGNSVTDFSRSAVGSGGYTIKLDVTGLLIDKITGVQAQSSPTDTPSPVNLESNLFALQGYLNSPAPNLAFNYSNGEVTILFNLTAFPYVSATRFAIFGLRNAQKMVNDTDYLDTPDRDIALVNAYALELTWLSQKGFAPVGVLETIENQERRIKDE